MPQEALTPHHLTSNRSSCGENSQLLQLSSQMNGKKAEDSVPLLSCVLDSDEVTHVLD